MVDLTRALRIHQGLGPYGPGCSYTTGVTPNRSLQSRQNDWSLLKIEHPVTCLATMAYVYVQYVLVRFNNSDRFQGVTCSYSSCPFLCALDQNIIRMHDDDITFIVQLKKPSSTPARVHPFLLCALDSWHRVVGNTLYSYLDFHV